MYAKSLRLLGVIFTFAYASIVCSQTTNYSGFMLGLRNPSLNKVAEAIDAKRWADAHRLYEKDLPAMANLSGSDLEIVRALVSHAMSETSDSLARCTDTLNNFYKDDSVLTSLSSWPALKSALEEARASLASASQFAVVNRSDIQFVTRDACDSARSKVVARITMFAPAAFANYFSGSYAEFESSYPITPELISFSSDLATEGAKLRSDQSSIDRLNRIAPLVAKHAAADSKRAFAFNFARTRLSVDAGFGLSEFESKYLESVGLFGLGTADVTDFSELGVAVRNVVASGAAADLPRLTFEKLAIPNVASIGALEVSGRWTLVVNPVAWNVSREIKDRAQPKSRFLAETRRVPNPAYTAAQIKFNDADFQLKRAQVDTSRLTGWAAVGGAFIVAGYASNREAAYRSLMSTAETLEEPVYKDYEYSTNKVVVKRRLDAEVLAIDSLRSEVLRAPLVIEDSAVFSLAYGIHEKDTDTNRTGFASEADVDVAEKSSIRLVPEKIFAGWKSGTRESILSGLSGIQLAAFQVKQTPAQQAAQAVSAAQQSDARFDSVVVIRTPKGAGTGFFVAANLVLTNHHVIEGSQFAEVKMRDGKETFGKVIRSDFNADLALIETAQTGKAVELSLQPLKVGDTVDLIGHPRGMDYSLTRGVVSAIRAISNPFVRGGNQVLMIQTDAAINPGNSGGPMFVGGKVVGVNTQKLRDGAGLGFAVHYSEVIRFMSASN